MKILAEFEFNSASDLEGAIQRLKQLRDDHIKASQCKEPDKCYEMRELWWLQITLENVLKQLEKFQNGEFKYKREEAL